MIMNVTDLKKHGDESVKIYVPGSTSGRVLPVGQHAAAESDEVKIYSLKSERTAQND